MLETKRNVSMGCPKALKEDGNRPKSKKDPRKLPRPEVQPERSKEDPKKDPRDPRGAPEATQDRKVSNSLSKIDGFK